MANRKVCVGPYEPHDPAVFATPIVGHDMAKQSMKDECDINKMIERFRKSGMIEALDNQPQLYADVSGYGDYHGSLEIVRQTDELFMTLPADVREEFANDAGAFVEFAANPANRDKMLEMGLLKPESGEPMAASAEGPEPESAPGPQAPDPAPTEPV